MKLLDSAGKVVSSSTSFTHTMPSSGNDESDNDACSVAVPGLDTTDGLDHRVAALSAKDQTGCCDACNANSDCETWIFATDGGSEGNNCWLMKDITSVAHASSRTMGGKLPKMPSVRFCAFSNSFALCDSRLSFHSPQRRRR